MTKFNLRDAVLDLLLLEVDRLLEGDRPDLLVDFRTYSKHSLETCQALIDELVAAADSEYDEAVADAEALHQARRVELARGLYRRYVKAALRFNLSLLPEDLRKWANRWLQAAKEAAKDAERKQQAELARVFVYLSVKDAVEWEQAHAEEVTLDSLVTASFALARDGEYDGGELDIDPKLVAATTYRHLAA